MRLNDELKEGIACDSVGKPESIFGRVVCLSVHPGKMILFPFVKWFDKRYRGKSQFAHLLFGFDLLLLGTLLGIASSLTFLGFSTPKSFEDGITLSATVAPREVVTGASSTLVIQYTNATDSELRSTKLSITYPEHFLLEEQGDLELGTILPGAIGSVHVKGVMFGDVGGEQTFVSTLSFVHGENQDIPGEKTATHTFSPTSSTLELILTLPEKLVAYQPVEGTITYHNTGEIDFPMIDIEPEWPSGFTFQSSVTPFVNGAFEVPAISAGEQGTITFTGTLRDVADEVTFIFHPSFTFEDRYQSRQESLVHVAPVVPPQLKIEHGISRASVEPGAKTVFTIRYENIGEDDLTNVVLGVESDSPFFSKNIYEVTSVTFSELASVAPGAFGEIEILIRLRSSILQSETTDYDGLDLVTRSTASYTLGGSGQRIASYGSSLTSPITTPIILESFGRYATTSGDQLGRGPLPPEVGEKTSYWVFWHVGGTINELTDISIEGTLGDNVTFTGRQSASQNSGVTYNETAKTISWQSTLLEPTLSPTSKVVGLAFELALTPNESMIGTTPTLLSDIRLTAVDGRTGDFVSASGSLVTTNLPNDLLATEKSQVE